MADNVAASRSSRASMSGRKTRRALQAVLVFLLFLCCVASFYFFMISAGLLGADDLGGPGNMTMPDVTIGEEVNALNSTGNDLTAMEKASSAAMHRALLAEVSGKYPIALSSTLAPPAVDPSLTGPTVAEIIEPDPPQVTVVAIMITGKDKIAILDILGEEDGLVVRQGARFSNNSARVTKIDAKGVTFTWMKKSYTVAM